MDFINLVKQVLQVLYGRYSLVLLVDVAFHDIDEHHTHQANKSKLLLYKLFYQLFKAVVYK